MPIWSSTGRTTRPTPIWAQMMVVLGWRRKRSRIWRICQGSWLGFGNGTSASLWMIVTRPASPAKSKIRSSAGSVSEAGPPAVLADTNSLWIVNSPIPTKTPGKVLSTRLMWSVAYMSAGLKPVIMGSNRACSFGVKDLYCMAIQASVKE